MTRPVPHTKSLPLFRYFQLLSGGKVDHEDIWEQRNGSYVRLRSNIDRTKIALAISGNAKQIEIVGIERIGKEWRGYSMEELAKKAKEILVESLVSNTGMGKSVGGKKLEGVLFTTFDDRLDG